MNVKFNLDKTNKDEVSLILSELEKLKAKEKRIKDSYIDGIDSLEEYKENKQNLENQKTMLNNQLLKLQNKKEVRQKEENIKEQLKTIYNILTDDKIDMQRKYEVSHMIIARIDFNRDDGILELTYKM